MNVDLLGAVSAGLIRGVDNDFRHKLMEDGRGPFVRLHIAMDDFQKAFDVQALRFAVVALHNMLAAYYEGKQIVNTLFEQNAQ